MEDLGTEEHVEGTKVTLRIPIKKKYWPFVKKKAHS
jgi:hypothetical protein